MNPGDVFGRWSILSISGKWATCRCVCGTERRVNSYSILSGASLSCGCLQREVLGDIRRTHGRSKTFEHRIWIGIKTRCYNENHKSYQYYGARGVKMCDRWRDSFENFLLDVGESPSKKHSLDRVDNGGDYEPGNVRWATTKQQARNKSANRILTFRGETRPMCEWAEILGMSRNMIETRLDRQGLSVEEAFTRPSRYKRRRPMN